MSVTTVEAPPRTVQDVGTWLCHRHPDLFELCRKIGAVVDGRVDVGRVRESVISFDSFHYARSEYNRKNGLRPTDPTPECASITLGPQPSRAAACMMVMMPFQVAWLRLLATTAPAVYGWPNVEWSIEHLIAVGSAGRALVADWLTAVAGVAGQ